MVRGRSTPPSFDSLACPISRAETSIAPEAMCRIFGVKMMVLDCCHTCVEDAVAIQSLSVCSDIG